MYLRYSALYPINTTFKERLHIAVLYPSHHSILELVESFLVKAHKDPISKVNMLTGISH